MMCAHIWSDAFLIRGRHIQTTRCMVIRPHACHSSCQRVNMSTLSDFAISRWLSLDANCSAAVSSYVLSVHVATWSIKQRQNTHTVMKDAEMQRIQLCVSRAFTSDLQSSSSCATLTCPRREAAC